VDSITHIALGAVTGEAIAGKSLGKRAMFIGALAQSIPDIDFITAFWLPSSDNLLVHRGFTHSLLFGVLTTLLLAAGAEKLHRPLKVSYTKWALFFGIEILLHLVLDVCNAYGVGWLEPFSHQRFSFNILFVADPFLSLSLGISLIVLMSIDSKSAWRRFWIAFGLVISSVYFLYAVFNKITIVHETKVALERQHISYHRLLTTPTPLNSWLWYVVVEDSAGFHTAYRATADDTNEAITFTYFPRQDELIHPFENLHDVQQLKRFSQGYYTVEQSGDTLIFNDLRFGQIAGWEDPAAKFVFHYYVNYPEANLLVIQRGRFSNWNRKTFRSMIDRIRGY